jgi:signal transduction histidine kinase/DNA-binding response OmpR family regulator
MITSAIFAAEERFMSNHVRSLLVKPGSWSLKTKLALTTFLIFAIGIGTLSAFAVDRLLGDFKQVISKEQDTTVSFVARTIDREVNLRISALQALAPRVNYLFQLPQAQLQGYELDGRVARKIFTRDIFVLSREGIRIAESPNVGSNGKNYSGTAYFKTAMSTGKPVILPATEGPDHQNILMTAVPIFADDGAIVGVLCGAELLQAGSFFYFSNEVRNGESGGFDVVAPKEGVFAASTNAERVLAPIPAKGTDALFDRRLNGYMGTAIGNDAMGIENLRTGAISVSTGWIVIAYITADEAFAPVTGLAERIYTGAVIIALLGGLLIWLLLRRELAPVEAASAQLDQTGNNPLGMQPLRVAGSAEIRKLFESFNRLQADVKEQNETIRTERDRLASTYAELKRAEESLRLLNQDLEDKVIVRSQKITDLYQVLSEVLQSLPFGVAVLDENFNLVLRNELYATLCRLPPEIFEKDPLPLVDMLRAGHDRGSYPGYTFEQVEARVIADLERAEPGTFNRMTPDGSSLEIRTCHISVDWILMTFRDTTAQKLADRTLEAALRVAEAATEAKSGFLAHMSHEIRTPMNAIIGLAYLLEKAGLSQESEKLAHKIAVAGRSLLSIINDILDFSKIEAGKIELEHVPFSLGAVLDNLATIMSVNVGSKDIELIITPPETRVDRLLGDPLRLEQILINLVGNGIKFTDKGHVELNVTASSETDQTITLRFAVRDTGIGIAADKQGEIFQPFSQAENSTTRHFGGTGLGLTISRRLVAIMGAEMGVVSEPGSGSEFSFSLTFERAPTTQLSAPEMAHLDVLIADDNPIAREALRRTAIALGWDPKIVDSGEAALDNIVKNTGHNPYKVIVLDWKMTGMDGLATANAIREAVHPEELGLIIIMVTAYSTEELLASADSGMADAVLTKPVTPSNLYNAVASARMARFGVGKVEAVRQTERLDGLRILIVDDTEINREVAMRIFVSEGAQVALANDGRQAVDWLLTHADEIDIVLMDVQMPVMDGLTATRLIRTLPAISGLPVIALTAGAFKSQEEDALAAGMTGFLSKPFDVDGAISLILKTVAARHHEAADGAARSAAVLSPVPGKATTFAASTAANSAESALTAAAAAASPRASPLPRQNFPGLAIERGLKIWKDETAYRQYLRKFARDFANTVAEMQRVDAAAAATLSHGLMGAAGNMALMELAAAAGEADHALRAGDDAGQLLIALQTAMDTAQASIRRYAPEPQQQMQLYPEQGAAPDRGSLPPLDRADSSRLLRQLLAAFNTDNPDTIAPLLAEMERTFSPQAAAAVREAMENFDFRGGESAVRALADANNIFMEV